MTERSGRQGSTFAALPTPFDPRGALDGAAIEHLTDYIVAGPIDGFALLTEAAEDTLLTAEERIRIVDLVCQRAGGKKPILVSISTPSSSEAVDLARHAAARGVHGLLVAPFRLPGFGYRELYRHLEKVGRAQDRPLYLVARPENAVDYLTPEEVATLAKHPRLSGVFLPGASGDSLSQWSRRFQGRETEVFSGCSLRLPEEVHLGVTAAICGVAMVAPDSASQAARAARGEHPKAKEPAGRLELVVDFLKAKDPAGRLELLVELLGPPLAHDDQGGFRRVVARASGRPVTGAAMSPVVPFALVKEALKILGHPLHTHVRPPHERASAEQVQRLRDVLKTAGLLA